MTPAGRRIADLEQQVADLTARVEELAGQAFTLRAMEEALLARQGFARPAALAASRPRHLRSVGGTAS